MGGSTGPSQPPKNRMHDQRRNQHDPEIFADEEHAELHAGVFGVEAGNQFTFRFGQVERQPPGFGHTGDRETERSRETAARTNQRCRLGFDNRGRSNEPASITTPMSDSPMKTS